MLRKNRLLRLARFEDIKKHDWFEEFNWEELEELKTVPEYIPETSSNISLKNTSGAYLKHFFETTKDVKVLLYNIYKAIPGIDLVSRELFRAILESFVRQQNTCHKSVNDFLKFIKAPIALSEVYPIMGLPQHCDLMVLDQCNQDFVDVIIHALLHNRITFQELYTMLSGHDAEEINLYGFDLTDFVRRNIVKHGSQTYKAFISVYSTSKTNMKEANLARLDAYCKKKGIKTFPAAYDSLMAGDGFGFLAALAGETK
jgi:hypothetical protein